jgi:hypothetical protein
MVSAESQTGPHPYTHHVSTAYLASLGLSMTAIFASRLLLRWVPLRNVATRISIFDAVVLILGLLGLGLHCGAMFFRSQFRSFPGGHLVIRSVDPLGTTSIVWFAITAVLVLFGLRRRISQGPPHCHLCVGYRADLCGSDTGASAMEPPTSRRNLDPGYLAGDP